jgi:hypothetical protein
MGKKSLLRRLHVRSIVHVILAYVISIGTVAAGVAATIEHYHTLAQFVGWEKEKDKDKEKTAPPRDQTALVALLKVRATDDLAKMQSVIDTLAKRNVHGKPVDVSHLRELKTRFEGLHARYTQAIMDSQSLVAHDTNDDIQQLLVDFRSETNSLTGGVTASFYDTTRFKYAFEPEPGQDKQYDEARSAVQSFNAETVDVAQTIEFPGPTDIAH